MNSSTKIVLTYFVLPVGLVVFFLLFLFQKPAEGESPVRIINKDWGTVTSIESCRKTKHSLYCRVETTKVVFNEIDITDFPHNNLKEGDSISFRVDIFEKSYHTYYIRNNWSISTSSCFWFMPCFDNYDEA